MRTCAWTPDKFQHPACALREIHRNTLLASYPSSHANPKVAEHNTLKPQGRRTQHGSPLFQRIVGDLCRHRRPCWAPTQTSATLPDPHADIGDLAGPSPRDRLTSPRNTVITAEVSGVKRSRGMGSNGVKRGWCYARSNDGRAAKISCLRLARAKERLHLDSEVSSSFDGPPSSFWSHGSLGPVSPRSASLPSPRARCRRAVSSRTPS